MTNKSFIRLLLSIEQNEFVQTSLDLFSELCVSLQKMKCSMYRSINAPTLIKTITSLHNPRRFEGCGAGVDVTLLPKASSVLCANSASVIANTTSITIKNFLIMMSQ